MVSDDKNNRALLFVSFPHQLLHALGALNYDRLTRNIPIDSPVEIFVWSFQVGNHATGTNFRKILEAAVQEFRMVKLYIPKLTERSIHLSPYRTLCDRVGWLKKVFAGKCFGAIYFSHDASSDRTAQVIMQTFPES